MKSKLIKLALGMRHHFSLFLAKRLLAALALLVASSALVYYQFFILPSHQKLQPGAVNCKTLVIGSGVGGLTSAIYLSQLGIDTMLATGNEQGGALATTGWVENWPGEEKIMGRDLVDRLTKHAANCGAQFLQAHVTKVDLDRFPYQVTVDNGKTSSTLKCYSLIIATGATPKKLEIPGEAVHWGKGVTTCAICDGPLHKGKDVVVIGGGDSAMTEAQILAPLARQVYVLVRKTARAKENLLQAVSNLPNVKIMYHTKPLEVLGDGQQVAGIKVDSKGKVMTLEVSGVFLAIGSTPNTEVFGKSVALTKDGLVKIDNNCQTSKKGVFAIGDVANAQNRQAVVAAGQGCVAALQCIEFLNANELNKKEREKKPKSQAWKKSSKPAATQTKPEASTKLEPSNISPETATQSKTQGAVINIKSLDELNELIEQSQVPMLVDFYATWCPPCKAMSPIIDSLAQELGESALVCKINIDQAPEAASNYSVQGVPTFLVIKDGKEVDRFVGYTQEQILKKALL